MCDFSMSNRVLCYTQEGHFSPNSIKERVAIKFNSVTHSLLLGSRIYQLASMCEHLLSALAFECWRCLG